MEKINEKLYIGLDIGTNSCGFAATDEDYNYHTVRGKKIAGAVLFDSAEAAEERRLFRGMRVRISRRRQRIKLLRDLLLPEIEKKDKSFFARLDSSSLWECDKKQIGKYSLFNDPNFTDKEYYKQNKTIYHLRKRLIENGTSDIRLLYIALHHIIKYRGNFLYEGQDFKLDAMGADLFCDLNNYLDNNSYEYSFETVDFSQIETVAKDTKLRMTERHKKLAELFAVKEKSAMAMLKAICGMSVKVCDIFGDTAYAEEKLSVKFSTGDFEEKGKAELENALGEDFNLIAILKSIYDWLTLARITNGKEYISDSMIEIYEKHQKDLLMLKAFVNEFMPEQKYAIFSDPTVKHNYCAFVGLSKKNGKKQPISKDKKDDTCTRETFLAFLKKTIEKEKQNFEDNDTYKAILSEIELGTFLPKITSADNGAIPYQLNKIEIEKILEKSEKQFPFLSFRDDSGYSVKEKIISLLCFRIPFYVGHLNNYHAQSGNAWIVKKENGKITPWTFDRVVDVQKTAEGFISRMTSDCTYLNNEKVIPKNSLLYSEFMLLNELNCVKINDERLSYELKVRIIEELFKKNKKVSFGKLVEWLKASVPIGGIGLDNISGVDVAARQFKSSLSSYITIKNIIGDLIDTNPSMAENVVFWHTVFNDKKLVEKNLRENYSSVLSAKQIASLKGLCFADFGTLSEKFLKGITSVSKITGVKATIIQAMRLDSKVLMEIINSDEYDFKEKIEEHNSESDFTGGYAAVKKLYTSPAVKRGIWQAVKIVGEITGALKKQPDKIFVEVTRGASDEQKNKRTESRKTKLLNAYKAFDLENLKARLESASDDQLRGDRLYLYFSQMGRCAYTGEPISLDELNGDGYDIDHIYPQSKIKDDSLNNRVLVTAKANRDKKDIYPLSDAVRTNPNNCANWKMWEKNGLISKEKLNRLTRKTPLTQEELAMFIDRQLVFTSQTAKAAIELLQQIYPDTKIVYSKAGNVSDFRQKFSIYKCREVNDLHHAHDAYLNVVVGNVYNAKFGFRGNEYLKKQQEDNESAKMDKLFTYNIKNAWEQDNSKSITTVKKMLGYNKCLITRKQLTFKGQFYDQTLYGKGSKKNLAELIPQKGNAENPLSDTLKYGGYCSWKGAYFSLIEYDIKNGRERALEQVPVMCAKKIGQDENALLNYFIGANPNLKNIRIIIPKIRMGALLKVNGSYAYLNGRTAGSLILCNANQWYVSQEVSDYVRTVVKFKSKYAEKTEDVFTDITIPSGIRRTQSPETVSREKNLWLYDQIAMQLGKPVYSGLSIKNFSEKLGSLRGKFVGLSTKQQVTVLCEMVKFLQTNVTKSDLSLLGEGSVLGNITISKKLKGEIYIVNRSTTGIYEKVVKISL